MLNPSVDELLAGMADALSRTVLPELAPGPARDELQAAIALTRRLARAVPRLGPYLHTDTVDLLTTLEQLWAACGIDEPTTGPAADAVAAARALPPDAPPDTTTLTATNLTLRQAVADLVDTVDPHAGGAGAYDMTGNGAGEPDQADGPADDHAGGGAADAVLRALLVRLADREADELRLSPWARLG